MKAKRQSFEDTACHVVEIADKLQEKLLTNKDLEMPDLEENSNSESDNLGMPDLDRAPNNRHRIRKDRQGGAQGGLFRAWSNVPPFRLDIFTS